MDISLKGSRAYGHKKRSDVHLPEVGAGDGVVAANRDLDDAVITSTERPHRPWLVPGVGTL